MGSLTRSVHAGRGTREKIGRGMRGLRARLLPSRWRRPKRDTPEEFIRSHRLAPAIGYARERVRAAFGELSEIVMGVYGYDLAAPYLAVDFYVLLPKSDRLLKPEVRPLPREGERGPSLELSDETRKLLEMQGALNRETRQRFGKRVGQVLLLYIHPAGLGQDES